MLMPVKEPAELQVMVMDLVRLMYLTPDMNVLHSAFAGGHSAGLSVKHVAARKACSLRKPVEYNA